MSSYNSVTFWNQYYSDLLDDASYEDQTTDMFQEALVSQLQKYKIEEKTSGVILPIETKRLETSVGYLGNARYEWMQSFTTLHPLLQQYIEPIMPGYTMPPNVLLRARNEALTARALQAGLPAPILSKVADTLILTDPVLVNDTVRVLQVGCGTSNMGEEMIQAGWPNVLNIDFSPICIDINQEQWNKAHWEEVQAKIEADLAEETKKEREMMVMWETRRTDSEKNKGTFAIEETKRITNKNKKREGQLIEFEQKMNVKINEATLKCDNANQTFELWKSAQPNEGVTAPGILTPEAQDKKTKEVDSIVNEIEKNVLKWKEKINAMKLKAQETLAQSQIDLEKNIVEHVLKESERITTCEQNEKLDFIQWQQDRRDYDTKGEGKLYQDIDQEKKERQHVLKPCSSLFYLLTDYY